MRPSKRIYLSLGSNVGERKRNLELALEALEEEGVHILRRSSVYETEPQDVREQPWFLNMAAECETRLFPLQLLRTIQKVERGLGRMRGAGSVPKGPRTIDIDILLFGDIRLETPALTIPHPRMLERRFMLEPLLEIAPELLHPVSKEPVARSLAGVTKQKIREA